MPQSESTSKLVTALAKAQSQFTSVPKIKTGREGNREFKYADLADVVGMITPILSKLGIFLSQPIVLDSTGQPRQTTRLQLEDEYIQTDGIKLPNTEPGKNLGISVTYARRIDLNGLLGIAPDEDVDAPDLTPAQTPEKAKADPRKTQTVVRVPSVVNATPAPKITESSRNPEITDEDLPKEMFGVSNSTVVALSPEDEKAAAEIDFVPLSKERNDEIQSRLKDLVTSKVVDRKKLSLFLDRQHDGKKSIDVSSTQWESTIRKINQAVEEGPEAIKELLKG